MAVFEQEFSGLDCHNSGSSWTAEPAGLVLHHRGPSGPSGALAPNLLKWPKQALRILSHDDSAQTDMVRIPRIGAQREP